MATAHTCGGPVFGKLAEPGTCPRCDELHQGAQPVRWRSASTSDAQRVAAIRSHRCGPSCGPVCTYGEW